MGGAVGYGGAGEKIGGEVRKTVMEVEVKETEVGRSGGEGSDSSR